MKTGHIVMTLVAALAASPLALANPAAQPAAAADAAASGHPHARAGAGRHLLAKLDLSPEQWTQVRSIYAQSRSRVEALRTAQQANRGALANTAPTDHPAYDTLVAAAKENAAARVQLRSDVWSQIYAVLTPAQQQAIPGIVAAEQAAREARRAARRSAVGPA